MSKIAVLTNDLQYDLVEKNPERVTAVSAAIPTFVSFLDSIRAAGHQIIHLQLVNNPDDLNAERYEDGFLPVQKGTHGADVMSEFLAPDDMIMEKSKDSGFYETDLHERLQDLGVETVLVTGMQTQICVQTTAADAFFRGYSVWVPSDCVVSARPEDRDRALQWLEGYCATVATSAEIVELIETTGDLPRKNIKTP
jgi:nicotinamidase-related amidase